MRKALSNSICDVEGILVGNAQSKKLKSGVTALICQKPTIASCHVMGGAPGTRESDLLSPENTVEEVNAIFLSGGSAFGLDAGAGIAAYLRQQNIGYNVGDQTIPIVPGAILFDLLNGGDKQWGKYPPYRELGFKAASQAKEEFSIGSVGAGSGALVAGLKGGLGTASQKLKNGVTVGALVAINAVGSPTIGSSEHFWAAPFEQNSEFGGVGFPNEMPDDATSIKSKLDPASMQGTNTTIAIIATDATLSKAQAKRLAVATHDGFARALYPVHTPMDGDIIYALATGKNKKQLSDNDWLELCAMSANVMSRAIARGVYEATPAKNDVFPTWKQKFTAKR